ncbi:hypothetical protein CCP3SC1_2450001 [Gammaproteobacteria bacterium]
MENIAKLAAASKTLQRDPETFEQFVEEGVKNGPVDTIFIDANTLFQSGIAEEVAKISPSVAEQLTTARATGGLIAIPTEEYLIRIAPTEFSEPLLDHVKFDPDGYTRAESVDFLKNHAEELQAEVEQVLKERPDAEIFRESQERVKQRILDELNTTNRFPQEVNHLYATLPAAYAATRAAKMGITPEQFSDRNPLRVIERNLGGEEYGQRGAATDTIHKATPERVANTLPEAREVASEFVGRQLYNESTGLNAVVSMTTLRKMTSRSAVSKSASLMSHISAVANADKLFRHALLDHSHPDARGEPTIVALHRYVAPMIDSDGSVLAVKMTVKETTGPNEPNPLYTIETIDVEKPARMAPSGEGIERGIGVGDVATASTGGPSEKVVQLLREVKDAMLKQGNRGAYNPLANTIILLQDADLSTFLHELGHYSKATIK